MRHHNSIKAIIIVALAASSLMQARKHVDYSATIAHAESSATTTARKILSTARIMVEQKIIVRGSCWDYLDTAYSKAGYGGKMRKVVYKKGKRGPFAPLDIVQPGDWLYYINHSYGDVEHSGMFIGWLNRSKKQGLILSYGGESRNKPGRYRPYVLSSIYQITRAKSP